MRLIFEDAADHYLEDPDNEERIKKAEKHAEKLADKPLPKVKMKQPRHKWMFYFEKGNTPFYFLNPFSDKFIYTKNRSDAALLTKAQMDVALKKYKAKFKSEIDGPYRIDESYNKEHPKIELFYDDLENPYDEYPRKIDWSYYADVHDILDALSDEIPEEISDEEAIANIDTYLDPNLDKVMEYLRDKAQQDADENYEPPEPDWDMMPGGHDYDR